MSWQDFHGSPEEFKDLGEKVLDERGEPREEYLGMDGYALFAETHYAGNMEKAFLNVSAVLSKSEFSKLGWQQFHGSPEEFKDLMEKVLDESGEPREEYLGIDGYALFAKTHYAGYMQKAFQNVSAVLSKSEFKKLGWQQFHGSPEEFKDLMEKVLDEKGKPREEYLGMDGYVLFAETHYDGDMKKAFQNVSVVLSKSEFKKLGWQAFHGSTEEFKDLREKVLDESGEPREEYLGMDGYALFAETHYVGYMQKAFQNVSSVLSKSEFKKLGWQQFHGSPEEFKDLREKVLDEKGKPREEYLGMDGYVLFAETHYEGDMKKAFQNVSAVLSKSEFNKLGWQQFHGSPEEFKDLREKVLDEKGEPREEYLGMDGYALFAETHYDGDMQKAFKNVSAVLGGASNMKNLGLGWKCFFGNVSEYQKLIQLFKDNDITEFQGIEEQKKVAREIFKGEPKRAYRNGLYFKRNLIGEQGGF